MLTAATLGEARISPPNHVLPPAQRGGEESFSACLGACLYHGEGKTKGVDRFVQVDCAGSYTARLARCALTRLRRSSEKSNHPEPVGLEADLMRRWEVWSIFGCAETSSCRLSRSLVRRCVSKSCKPALTDMATAAPKREHRLSVPSPPTPPRGHRYLHMSERGCDRRRLCTYGLGGLMPLVQGVRVVSRDLPTPRPSPGRFASTPFIVSAGGFAAFTSPMRCEPTLKQAAPVFKGVMRAPLTRGGGPQGRGVHGGFPLLPLSLRRAALKQCRACFQQGKIPWTLC
jgi:hypothetical protein